MSDSRDLRIGSCGGGVTTRRIEKAGRADVPLLRRFATQVYDVSFHDKHREPAEAWMQRLLQPGGEPVQHASLLLGDPAGASGAPEVLAGALSETYRGGVVLLTYIVVHPECRGMGLGSRLMREVREKHAGSMLVAEMADPERCASEDRDEALRRARVFDAWGWRVLERPYLQPPLEDGDAWASDLLLLHHGEACSVPRRAIDSLEEGLRSSLAAGEPPEGLTHRFSGRQGAGGGHIETLSIAEVAGYGA